MYLMLSAQKLLVSFRVGAISALVTAALVFLIPASLHPLTVADCQPDSRYPELLNCIPLPNAWMMAERVVTVLGFFGVPALIGVWFGIRYARGDGRYVTMVIMTLLASATYVVGEALLEMLFLQPWDSVPYNRYTLDAIFGTAVALLFVFISMIGVTVSGILSRRFWSNFKPFGFLNSQKPQ